MMSHKEKLEFIDKVVDKLSGKVVGDVSKHLDTLLDSCKISIKYDELVYIYNITCDLDGNSSVFDVVEDIVFDYKRFILDKYFM